MDCLAELDPPRLDFEKWGSSACVQFAFIRVSSDRIVEEFCCRHVVNLSGERGQRIAGGHRELGWWVASQQLQV